QLVNPPIGAENWSLSLTDWDITVPIRFVGWNGKQRLNIAEVATFEIPGGLTLPLRIMSLQITKWNEAKTALIVLYEIQSSQPYLWDWDLGDWSDEPDPSYREVFIPDLGSYYYYVDVEEMILVGAAPPTQDWMAIIVPVLTLGLLAGLMLPMMKGMFKK
ncbi:unnamed protein product, partial [marine sediment metagenome]